MAVSISAKLSNLLGADSVLPEGGLDEYSIDGLIPRTVVRPDSRRGIVEAMRWASGEGVTVFPRGGGTQLGVGNIPKRVDLVLDLSRCGRVLDFQPSDLTVTVEAGITLDSLQQALAQGGKFLPVEAPLAERATIGGILASQSTGPLRVDYGLPRDWLIGIHVVSPQGVETKAGGKVVKNVTGYDLDKLYTGSLGTLGVIVEATFKLSPLPENSGALVATFPSMRQAIDAAGQLQQQVYAPQGLQIIDNRVAARLDAVQQLASGTIPINVPELEGEQTLSLSFYSGRTLAVRRKLREATRLLREQGASVVDELGNAAAARLLRGLTDLTYREGAVPYMGLKVTVPPSLLGRVVAWLREPSASGHHGLLALAPSEVPPGIAADPGFGRLWIMWWINPGSGVAAELDDSRMVGDIGRIRQMVSGLGGSVVVETAPPEVKRRIDVWGDLPEGIEIMRRIKEKFDPRGILNPGRFVGGI
ncbi:MAG: FAD-binding oxidoreductase [Chloroflexi bacterium]|nr:FAD-binding oxidoreductase [Chloroflexota bacterium]